MGERMRSHDWRKTPLGPLDGWPQPLKTLLSVMLGSNQPMFVVWGAERTLLYNDAYAEILAGKHPSALGRDFLETWSEIRTDLVPIVEKAYGGHPVHMDDIALVMLRKGYPEETHFSFSYTPVRDAGGQVAGFFCPCLEITGKVLSDRHRAFRLSLEERLRELADPLEMVSIASEGLGRHLNVGQVAYAEVEASGDSVWVEREWNVGSMSSVAGRHRLADYGPAFAADLKSGQKVAIADVREDPRTSSVEALAAFGQNSIVSFLNVPVVKAGRLVAILAIHNDVPRPWSADEISLVEEFSERIWAAVEQARAEALLQQTSQRLNTLLDNASVSIFLMDGEHRCLYMNPAAEKLTGYTLSETRGSHLHDIIHHTRPDGSPYPSHECPIDGVSPAAGRQAGEEVFVHKSGRFIPVAFTASPLRYEAGAPIGTIIDVQDMTERKAAEAELEASRAQLEASLFQAERKAAEMRAVLESMPDAVYIGGTEGITLANQPALDQLGFSDLSELNRHVATLAEEIQTRDIATGVQISVEDQAFTRAFAGERVVQDVRVRHLGSGEDRIVRCAAAPVVIDGEVIAAVAVNTDITEAKRAEAELRESEEQLRLATEAGEIGLWDLDVTTDTLFWPARVKAMFGISADAPATMRDFYAGLHPEDRERVTVAFAAGIDPEQRAQYNVEYRVIGKEDGVVRWVAAKGRGIFSEAGRCVRMIGTAIDITAQRETEAALRESEARVRALTDNLPAGMVYQIATGRDGRDRRFLYISQSHEKLTGVPAEAVMANPAIAYDLILPEYRELLAKAEAEAVRTDSPFDVEARFRRADGEVRWCRILSAPRRQADGSTIWDGIQIDTTEQKAAEASLRKLNETLESRVSERTAELEKAHEQLRQSQKLEAMGTLTGGVSHDFNNLLSPIIGSLDLLHRKGVGTQRERRLIDGALQSAERARVLVQRLLAFARRQPLQPKPVDLGNLVSGMADLIASTSGPNVKVVVDLAEALPHAVGDPNQIEMAILNLAVNARDAMEGGGTLTISAAEVSVGVGHEAGLSAGRYVRLSVADTGIGMDQTTASRAIEPFFSTKGVGRGTGLGLSMVHGLASQLGGVLRIKSRPGEGTNVEIWLPASADKAGEAPLVESDAIHSAAGTVLLVDDEDLVRISTADMLTDLGYEVVEASSAQEALRLIGTGLHVDKVVTDHLMPGMTGTELAWELRAQSRDLPVLLVSGYAEFEGIDPDLPRLVKPFRQSDLAARLRELDQTAIS